MDYRALLAVPLAAGALDGMEVLLKDGSTRLPVSQSFQPRFKPM